MIDVTNETLRQNILGGKMNLTDYGFLPQNYTNETKGCYARVIAVHKESYNLISEQGECNAKLKSSIYFNHCTEEYPTVGDLKSRYQSKELICIIISSSPTQLQVIRK